MARRGARKAKSQAEPAVIAQANPTPEQRARSAFIEAHVPNPEGAVVTVTTRRVDGQAKTERVVHQHKACRRVPLYETLHKRKVICDLTFATLAWYDKRLGLARKGLTRDSLARANSVGGNSDITPTEAAAHARIDVDWARSFISDGMGAVPIVFDLVMEKEMTFAEIGGGNWRKEKRASSEFKLAANWMMMNVAHRVLPAT